MRNKVDLTGYHGFTTAAGYVGPHLRVDHDISLLAAEIWARLNAEELEPTFLIKEGFLEPVKDFEHAGRNVPASRLGYRITDKFVRGFLGRVFNNPNVVIPPEMLRPETQGLGVFVQGAEAIVEAQKRVAEDFFADGSADLGAGDDDCLSPWIIHQHTPVGWERLKPNWRALSRAPASVGVQKPDLPLEGQDRQASPDVAARQYPPARRPASSHGGGFAPLRRPA